MTPSRIIRTAQQKGLTRIAITDHFYPSSSPAMIEDVRRRVRDTLSELNEPPEIFVGCEMEIMAPGQSAGGAVLASCLDFTMAAGTHFQNRGITDLPKTNDLKSLAAYYMEMFKYAISLEWVDTIAHPFLVIPEVCSPQILEYIEEKALVPLLELAKKNDVAMEISPRALYPWQIGFSRRFYPLCKNMGLRFSVGSDAHSVKRIGDIKNVEWFMSEIGLEEKDLWMPLGKASKLRTKKGETLCKK